MNFYRQCNLCRAGWQLTAWVPKALAVEGKFVKLWGAKGWEDGWLVVRVMSRVSEEYLRDYSRDYLTQREASDI